MLSELLTVPARQAATLEVTEHRPWPLPEGGWTTGQTWDDLLFAHWPVDVDLLRPLVPGALEIETRDGSAWLGIVPFVLTGLRLRGTLPLPGLSELLELNVRTYVSYGGKPGIWFLSLDASSALFVEAARRMYQLPYYRARMSMHERGGWIEYSSSRRDATSRPFVFEARYRGTGAVFSPVPGSLEHFLTERYCLYTTDGGSLFRAEAHHEPWRLHAAEAEVELNSMAPDAVELVDEPLLHYAARQDAVVWPLERVG